MAWISNSSYGLDFSTLFDPFSNRLGVFDDGGFSGGALVLDSERGELVKAPATGGGKKGTVSQEKAMAALKNHSEAERRRRERINAHLATLRGLVPCTDKMDKAALLSEVISQLKELTKNATESSQGYLIPTDVDEVRVEPLTDDHGTFSFRASFCCDYRPELLSDLRHAIDSLHLNIVKAEISTLGDRVKNVFLFSSYIKGNVNVDEKRKLLADSIRRALSSVLDKVSTSIEYSPRTTLLPNKRRRISFSEFSSSSS